jgi:hypothetical protein
MYRRHENILRLFWARVLIFGQGLFLGKAPRHDLRLLPSGGTRGELLTAGE